MNAKFPEPLISLIVPVYNCDRYILNCLESILDQSFKNYEVIIIDDGSTDGSGSIAGKFCMQDARFRLLSKDNEGVSPARNSGLQHARGRYVTFVDADDWLDSNYLIKFVELIDGTNSLIMQNHSLYSDGVSIKSLKLKSRNYTREEFNTYFKELNLIRNGHGWSKLFAKDLLDAHEIRFDTEISYAEDCLFMLQYLQHVEQVKFSDYPGYYYRQGNQNSLSNVYMSPANELKAFNIFKMRIAELDDIYTFNKSTEQYFGFWLAKFFLRSIQAPYRMKNSPESASRINAQVAAHAIYDADLMSNLNFSSTNLHTIVALYLFRFKRFYLYDVYMRLFMKTRQFKLSVIKVLIA